MNEEIVETIENLYFNPYYGDREREEEEERISSPFQIKPDDFLCYARVDLDQGDERGLVNALTNTKRAIECQIDTLLFHYGFSKFVKKNRLGFPQKTEILQNLGILTPGILDRINSKRVRLEHYYEKPDKERVEDAIDVSILFIEFTNKFMPLRMIMRKEFVIEGKYIKTKTGTLDSIKTLVGSLEYDHKIGFLKYSIINQQSNDVIFNIEMEAGDQKYIEWMKVIKNQLTGLK